MQPRPPAQEEPFALPRAAKGGGFAGAPPPASRETFTDALRGFALLGIVLVNAPFLGLSFVGYTPASVATGLDRAAAFATVALAQAKFYVLFAFLFGYSLSFLLDAADRASRMRFYRRLIGLAVLGTLHAALFFTYDILALYAFLGVALPWLARKPDASVRRAAITFGTLWCILLAGLVAATAQWPEDAATLSADNARIDAILAAGSFWQATQARLALWPGSFGLIATLNGLGVLMLFCVGLLAGRRKLLADVARHTALWRVGLRWGFLLGLPLSIAAAWLQIGSQANLVTQGWVEMAGVALGFAAAPLLSWGYVSALAWLYMRRPRLLAPLEPEGRMSLTIYVGESAVLSLLFCGYGLGLYGQLGAATVAAIAIATWAALSIGATLWQRGFAHGPLEAALRAWTKGVKRVNAKPPFSKH